MRKQFAKTLLELGRDPKLVVLIGDISHYLLKDFQASYPDRFYNMGIAEQAMMSIASGLALKEFYPVVHSITPFVTERCYEQIKDDLCYQNVGVNIVSVGSAFDYASLGCTHHCYGDIAILRTLPNMQIIYPAAPHEFEALFKETYANGSPTYFRLPAATHRVATSPKFGEAERIREGSDATIIAIGPQLQSAVDAAEKLAHEDIHCDVIYLTTLKPITPSAHRLIRASIEKTKKVVTIEEHSVIGGLGDIVAGVGTGIGFAHTRLGINDKFLLNYGSYAEHCAAQGLTAEGVEKAVRQLHTSS